MRIDELLDMDQLCLDIENGYVIMRTHPENPELHILNYADKCQYEPYWTDVTRKTRGLIYSTETLEIVARPFEKFFNYGQEAGVEFDLDAPILGAFDKLDGSLGVSYVLPDGRVQIATRGSFESDQAIHANQILENEPWLQQLILDDVARGHTTLWEIVYPENRIVVDYGDKDQLMRLGSVNVTTGEFEPNYGLHIESKTLREVLSLPDRHNVEGLVVWIDPKTAVKIKQQDYIELHRIVSSLSQKEVWRQLSAGTYDEFVQKLPDEFYGWADNTANELRKMFWDIEATADVYFTNVKERKLDSRKDQALYISAEIPADYRGMMFSLLDGRDISDGIWKRIEPVGANPMKLIVD